jgi:hypothetical protein
MQIAREQDMGSVEETASLGKCYHVEFALLPLCANKSPAEGGVLNSPAPT